MNTLWNKITKAVRGADKSAWPYIYGIVLIFILLVAGKMTYQPSPPPSEKDPVALQANADLNQEMAEMKPVPGGKYGEVRNSWRERGFRKVSVQFTSGLTYQEIVKHYERQLKQRGWVYDAVRHYKSEDYNNMYPVTFYKKGGYYAAITNYGGKYYLTFEWWARGGYSEFPILR